MNFESPLPHLLDCSLFSTPQWIGFDSVPYKAMALSPTHSAKSPVMFRSRGSSMCGRTLQEALTLKRLSWNDPVMTLTF